jgi:hypothetical protein
VPTKIHNAVRHSGGVAVMKALKGINSVLIFVTPALNVIDPSYYAEQGMNAACANNVNCIPTSF